MALLKRRIAEGAFGRVRQISCAGGWIRKQDYYARAAWAGQLRVGEKWVLDGSANNPMNHQINNMLFLASPQPCALATPTAVRAELYAGHDIAGEDTAAIEIQTVEGPKCYFLATLCSEEIFGPDITVVGENATACRSNTGRVTIRYNDGRIEEPTPEDPDRCHLEKFENFIAAVTANDPAALRCNLEMCRPFTLTINGAFESATRVRRIPPEFIITEGEGLATKIIIQGIDAAIAQAARQGSTFSDLQLPWGQPTRPFDLTGYDRFPVQFETTASDR